MFLDGMAVYSEAALKDLDSSWRAVLINGAQNPGISKNSSPLPPGRRSPPYTYMD
jgi:hypothetical protein